MKKIISSLGVIVFAAAVVAGGTGAFFSDTETSTGNVFTAGAIDLTVDSEAHYNGMICVPNTVTTDNSNDYYWQPEEGTVAPFYPAQGPPCFGTWAATDLGAQTFFNYTDVKPGDEGENTISLHIDSNPAWACVDVTLTSNDDVSSNEPELGAGDVANTADLFDGELAQNMKFAAWLDQGTVPGWQNSDDLEGNDDAGEGDNVWQGDETEPLLFSNQSGPASDVLGGKTYALADSTTLGGPMAPNVTNYLGLQWCAGTQVVSTALNTITCDGSTLGNIVQTDSMVANIAFRVEQSRNNEDFTCVTRTGPTTGAITVDKSIGYTQDNISVPISDFAMTLTGPGGAVSVFDVTQLPALQPGAYTFSESYTGSIVGLTYDATFTGDCAEVNTSNTGTINLVAGQSLTCNVLNTITVPVEVPPTVAP